MNAKRPAVINEPLIAVRPNGTRVTFQLVISDPYPTFKKHDQVWSCKFSMKPLHKREIETGGSTPFQALSEAIAFANSFLTNVVDEGGKILLPSGADFRLPRVTLASLSRKHAV
jgi:hypothetical protein